MRLNKYLLGIQFIVTLISFKVDLRAQVPYTDSLLCRCKVEYTNGCIEKEIEYKIIENKELKNELKFIKKIQKHITQSDTSLRFIKNFGFKYYIFDSISSNDTSIYIFHIFGNIFDYIVYYHKIGKIWQKGLVIKDYKKLNCKNKVSDRRYIDIDFFIKYVKPILKFKYNYYCSEIYLKYSYYFNMIKQVHLLREIEKSTINYY